MRSLSIAIVAGARPDFMKAEPPHRGYKRSALLIASLVLHFILIAAAVMPACALSQDANQADWAPLSERIKIWDSVAGKGNYSVSPNQIEATFKNDGTKWTIMGANAPVVTPTAYPNAWPVKGERIAVLVIKEPITDYKILPFTEPIENAVESDKVSIVAALDSYEPASFVIRAGDKDLSDVTITIGDLASQPAGSGRSEAQVVFPGANIDIRTVKCWYQAGLKHNDVRHKNLRPELLLHDDDLVRVDYERQVNLVRNVERLEDADRLKPFDLPKRQNKQIWLTVHVDGKASPGKYYGEIKITAGTRQLKTLSMGLEVLPLPLPEPMLEYAAYYLGHLSDKRDPLSSDFKTEQQMTYELEDMREHGLANATVYHRLASSNKGQEVFLSWRTLRRTLEIRERAGWGKKPLLYLDWVPAFSDNLALYRKKVDRIVEAGRSFGIGEIYIYGIDEAKGERLLAERPLFETVRQAGAKNFVACTSEFFTHVPDLLDLPILHGKSDKSFMPEYRKAGNRILVYSNTGAKVEEPETYRAKYGIGLLKDGFMGACVFAYQAFYWNDFSDQRYRAHTLAYPTITKPLPTIQWEGWRAGINDIRYLTLLKRRNQLSGQWFDENCSSGADSCRQNAISQLLRN